MWGGFFSRQAWGWGNVDVIENFKLQVYFITRFHDYDLKIISEHDDDVRETALNISSPGHRYDESDIQACRARRKFLLATYNWVFPGVYDRDLLGIPEDVDYTQANKKWVVRELLRLAKTRKRVDIQERERQDRIFKAIMKPCPKCGSTEATFHSFPMEIGYNRAKNVTCNKCGLMFVKENVDW